MDKLADFATRRSIGFTLLSDPRAAIIRAFDVLDSRYGGFTMAHPIVFVIDPEGVIRHRFSGVHYRERPEIDLVLETLRKQPES